MLFLLILILSLLLQFFLPWWIIALIAFAFAFWKARTVGHAFGQSFSAIFVLWIIMGLLHSIPNENLLANRVAEMLTLPSSSFNWIIVLLATGLIGGLVAGIAALAGFYSAAVLKNKRINADSV